MICTQIAPLNFTITDEEVIDLTSPCFDGIFDNTPLGDGTDEIITTDYPFVIKVDNLTTALTTTVNLNCKSLETNGVSGFKIGNVDEVEYSGVFLFNITCDSFTNKSTIEFDGEVTINCNEFTNKIDFYVYADATINCDKFTNEGTIEFDGEVTINCDEFTNKGYIYIYANTTINCGKLNFKNEIKTFVKDGTEEYATLSILHECPPCPDPPTPPTPEEVKTICKLEDFTGELVPAIDPLGLEYFEDWLKANESYFLTAIFGKPFTDYCYENLEVETDATVIPYIKAFMPHQLFYFFKKHQNAILVANFSTEINTDIEKINVQQKLIVIFNKGVDLLAQNLTDLSVIARQKITKINIQKINLFGV